MFSFNLFYLQRNLVLTSIESKKMISHRKWETQIEIIIITAENLEEKVILLAAEVLEIESTKERAVPG